MNGYNTLKYRELQGNVKYNQFINGAKIGFFGRLVLRNWLFFSTFAVIYKFINARTDLIKSTMTHEEIICYLWGKQIPQKFANIVPARVFDDFVQYCYIELLRIDPQRLTDLYNARKLDAFFYRMCRNQAVNPRSMFFIHCGELPMLIGKVTFTPLDDRGGVKDEEE